MKTPWHNLAALACLGLAFVLMGGCKPKGSGPGKDFSHADSISVKLAKANWSDGLRQVEPEKGLGTKVAKVGGFECRCLKTPDKQEGFLYFTIDPTFKATNAQEVKVVVQYFDATEGSFSIDYDGQAGKYTKAESLVHQKASAQWETAEFILRKTRFDNLQDNNADFRLRVKVPEFFVRRVEVLRDTTPAITDQVVSESVTVLMQEPPVQEGLRLIQEADGKSTPTVIEGQACRQMNRLYLYFAIDPSFKWAPKMRVRVDVELFDASPGTLVIQYDGWSEQGTTHGAYTQAPRTVQLRQQKKWRTESFLLPEGRFENRENGRSDFRLLLSKPELYVRRVTVSRDASPDAPTPPSLLAGSRAVRQSREPSWEGNPLYMAALKGDLPRVKEALDQNPELINQRVSEARSTLLHTAAYHGRAQVVEELLRRKADVNARNRAGHTPLYDCVTLDGTPEIALMLLKHGADPAIPDNGGKTPLQLAMEKHRDDLTKCLRQYQAPK